MICNSRKDHFRSRSLVDPVCRLRRRLIALITLLVATIGMQPYGVRLAAQAPTTYNGSDLVIVMFGSDEMPTEAFESQKAGLAAALNSPMLVLRDGTFSFTVLQAWRSNDEDQLTVEIPKTVIEPNADIDQLVVDVLSIPQRGGSGRYDDFIDHDIAEAAYAALLGTDMNPDYEQAVCMLRNSTPNVVREYPLDVRSTVRILYMHGVDRSTLVVLGDPIPANDLYYVYYDAWSFGITSDPLYIGHPSAYAQMMKNCFTPPPPVTLRALEVNQSIQNWNNDIFLIEGKTTYVRAFFEPVGQDPVTMTAQLRAFRDGRELEGSPLTPDNPGSSSSVAAGFVRVDGTVTPQDRVRMDSSLYFRLPGDWLHGLVTLQIEGGNIQDCTTAPGVNADCFMDIEFEESPPLKIRLAGLRWDSVRPHGSQFLWLARALTAMYPIADLDYTTTVYTWEPPGVPHIMDVVRSGYNHWLNDVIHDDIIQYIFVPIRDGMQPNRIGGAAAMTTTYSAGYFFVNSEPRSKKIIGHEIAHLLGEQEAVNTVVNSTRHQWAGPCSERDTFDKNTGGARPFPHIYTINGKTMSTISALSNLTAYLANQPSSADNTLLYGLDSSVSGYAPEILEPITAELMGYCSRKAWPSDITYTAIYSQLYIESIQSAATSNVPPPTSMLLVSGALNADTNTITFLPFATALAYPTSPPDPDALLTLTLVAYDSTGTELERLDFAPYLLQSGIDETTTFAIDVAVPANPAIHEIRIFHEDTLLGSRTASTHAPQVTITAPVGGTALLDDTVQLAWTASDLDDDALTYDVFFSPDGGTTWDLLTAGLTETTFSFPREYLTGTTNGMFEVIASDGFHSASDTTDGPLTLPNNGPAVIITGPADWTTYVGTQMVFLDGLAYDQEDGSLDDAALVWSSDVDGILGSGETLSVIAADLTEGQHTITLTASDSDGLSASETVTIYIQRVDIVLGDYAYDLNADGLIDVEDVNLALANLGRTREEASVDADFDNDGFVTPVDVIAIINRLEVEATSVSWIEY